MRDWAQCARRALCPFTLPGRMAGGGEWAQGSGAAANPRAPASYQLDQPCLATSAWHTAPLRVQRGHLFRGSARGPQTLSAPMNPWATNDHGPCRWSLRPMGPLALGDQSPICGCYLKSLFWPSNSRARRSRGFVELNMLLVVGCVPLGQIGRGVLAPHSRHRHPCLLPNELPENGPNAPTLGAMNNHGPFHRRGLWSKAFSISRLAIYIGRLHSWPPRRTARSVSEISIVSERCSGGEPKKPGERGAGASQQCAPGHLGMPQQTRASLAKPRVVRPALQRRRLAPESWGGFDQTWGGCDAQLSRLWSDSTAGWCNHGAAQGHAFRND